MIYGIDKMIRISLFAACLYSCLALQPVSAEEPDPDALFKQAMKYRANGDIFTSIEIFETILNNQPALNRARLELAISYHLTRRYNAAKAQLIKVLKDPTTPDEVKLSITAYLAQLSADIAQLPERSKSSFYLSFGALNDTNIRLTPDLPNASEESASGAHVMLSYSNRSRANQPFQILKKMVDFEWLTQATAYSKAYASGYSDFNLSVLSLNTGPALIAEKSWRTAFNLKLEKLHFGNDDYAEYTGINPFFTYSLLPDFEITFENSTVRRVYNQTQDQGLQGTMTSWNIDLAKFYSKQLIGLQTGFRYHDNGADDGFLHYTGAEFYLGGQMPVSDNARTYLTLSSRDYNYKAADTANSFFVKRSETEFLAVLGVSHNFRSGSLKSWTLNAEYTFTNNNSNIDEFDYDRNTVELNMRRYFF